MLPVENDLYTPIISRFLRIEDTTWGDEKKGYIVRFRGQLYNQDSAQAYDQLAQVVHPQNIPPLFRLEENRHVILLMNGIIQSKPTKMWGNIMFFILTLFSVAFAGAIYSSASSMTNFPTNITGWFN